jgi:SAM-dependent methyltransferase
VGSKKIQGDLWGRKAGDWSQIQEATNVEGFEWVLDQLDLEAGVTVLDIGCGSGSFCALASITGAGITGLDASAELLKMASQRAPGVTFLEGEMESLPFADNSFDVVCGFNSFQYAENIRNAFAEAKRVLKDDGTLVVMIWGNKEDCEAATYLKAVGSCLPPPPPGAAGPFALSENDLLQTILKESGFELIRETDLPLVWDYPDQETAMRGLLAAGPAARAIEHSGYDEVHKKVGVAVEPYIDGRGHVVYKNSFRIVLSEKA